MADIQTLMKKLLSAVYGKDVRQAIHDAISQCYYDGKAGSIDLKAREDIKNLDKRVTNIASLPDGSTKADAELVDIRVDVGGTVHESAGVAVRTQFEKMSKKIDDIDNKISNAGIPNDIARNLLNLFAHVSYYDKDISGYYSALVNSFGLFNIVYNLNKVVSSNTSADIPSGKSFETTLTASGGYYIDEVSVIMNGEDITESAYLNRVISISEVTGNIVITASAVKDEALFDWDFTTSLVDSVAGEEVTLMTGSTQESDGIHNGRVKIFNIMAYKRTIEIDFALTDYKLGEVNAILCGFQTETGGSPSECLIYRKTGYWYAFNNSTNTYFEGGTHSDANIISGKTLKLNIDADGIMSAYVDDELIAKYTTAIDVTHTLMILGSQQNGYADFVVSGLRVYEGVR